MIIINLLVLFPLEFDFKHKKGLVALDTNPQESLLGKAVSSAGYSREGP